MTKDQNKNLVRRFFDEICNGRKLNVADELFTPDHAHHDPQIPGIGPGPEGIKQLVSTYQTAYPDVHWEVLGTIADENNVVTRWEGSGTHKKELNGIQPTGKFVKVQGIWIHHFEGNKIAESWVAWDVLGMLQQLGVVSAMQHEEV